MRINCSIQKSAHTILPPNIYSQQHTNNYSTFSYVQTQISIIIIIFK